jgi:hypothetical protein
MNNNYKTRLTVALNNMASNYQFRPNATKEQKREDYDILLDFITTRI